MYGESKSKSEEKRRGIQRERQGERIWKTYETEQTQASLSGGRTSIYWSVLKVIGSVKGPLPKPVLPWLLYLLKLWEATLKSKLSSWLLGKNIYDCGRLETAVNSLGSVSSLLGSGLARDALANRVQWKWRHIHLFGAQPRRGLEDPPPPCSPGALNHQVRSPGTLL